MNRRISTFLTIALMGCLVTMIGACADDDDIKTPAEEQAETKLNGVEYVRRNLLSLDANGNYVGMKWGVFIDESRPTTAYVSVENQEEAREIWHGLIPYDTEAKAEGKNEVVVLTDEQGQVQGQMHFNVLDESDVLAEIAFSSAKLIDSHVSRVVFVLASMWGQNGADDLGPMPRIMVRKTTGEKYAVIRKPSTMGSAGYIMHVGEKRYINEREHERGNATLMKYFPSTSSMRAISTSLKSSPDLWKVLAESCSMTVEDLKNARFFISRTTATYDFMFNLSTQKETFSTPLPYNYVQYAGNSMYAGYWNYVSRVYLMTISNQNILLTMDNNFTKVPADVASEINLTMNDFELIY